MTGGRKPGPMGRWRASGGVGARIHRSIVLQSDGALAGRNAPMGRAIQLFKCKEPQARAKESGLSFVSSSLVGWIFARKALIFFRSVDIRECAGVFRDQVVACDLGCSTACDESI